MCGRGRVGIKVYPHNKIFTKLVNKNAIKLQKSGLSLQSFDNPPIYPSSQKLSKTSWTLLLDFLSK
jgi:hypothetical protein